MKKPENKLSHVSRSGYSLTLVFCSLRVAVPSPYVTPWGEGAATHRRRVMFSKMNNEQEMLELK